MARPRCGESQCTLLVSIQLYPQLFGRPLFLKLTRSQERGVFVALELRDKGPFPMVLGRRVSSWVG